ncbi:MAG: glycosyltransferase family 4 protein [Candidatus Sumerlaeia bacterium]|nr:glycosyltransferase family 4 protein [Candidatus Sumerlaeia bacterium]
MPQRRILLVNYEFPPLGGGAGTATKFHAWHLSKFGHDVEVVTAAHKGLARVSRRGSLVIRRIPALRRERGRSNPLEMMSYVASAVPYLMFRPGPKPDVMVSYHSIPSGLAAFPLSYLWGVPHVVLFRGGDVPGWLPGELDKMHRRTLRLNQLIVHHATSAHAVSQGLRDLAQPSFPGTNIGVLRNGVDTNHYHPPREGREDRKGPVRLLFAGRMTTQKGVDTLLGALGSDPLRSMNWVLDLAGGGPMLEHFLAMAQELGIRDRVKDRGWMERADLRCLYQEADIFVFPSRFEGMPNVVLEAISCGLPIIGTRITGIEEILREGENGFMIDVDDVGVCADRIAKLVNDKDLRLEMGRTARMDAVRFWSWKPRARELEQILESAIAGNPRQG